MFLFQSRDFGYPTAQDFRPVHTVVIATCSVLVGGENRASQERVNGVDDALMASCGLSFLHSISIAGDQTILWSSHNDCLGSWKLTFYNLPAVETENYIMWYPTDKMWFWILKFHLTLLGTWSMWSPGARTLEHLEGKTWRKNKCKNLT